MNKITVFDFDGTLTERDTFLPMSLFFLKNMHFRGFFRYICFYILFKFGKVSNEKLKTIFLKSFFKGKLNLELKKSLNVFFKEHLKINTSIYRCFKQSLEEGDRVVILSANFDIIIESWLESIDIKNIEVIATKLSCDDLFVGNIIGNICRGEEKVKRFKEKIDNIEEYFITSYADEPSDQYIMQLANKVCWVGQYEGE